MFHILSIFAQMIGRYLEHLFGFTAPISGSRAQAGQRAGYFGVAPLDNAPFTYVPPPVIPQLLPLEFRLAIGEAGWGQAPHAAIVTGFSTVQAISNARIVFIGSRRSSIDMEGPYLVASR
jgi:hypothetical protein